MMEKETKQKKTPFARGGREIKRQGKSLRGRVPYPPSNSKTKMIPFHKIANPSIIPTPQRILQIPLWQEPFWLSPSLRIILYRILKQSNIRPPGNKHILVDNVFI